MFLIKNNLFKFDDKFKKILFIWILLSPIPASLTIDQFHITRMEQMLTVVPIFISAGIYIIYKKIPDIKYLLVTLILILSLIYTLQFLNYYFTDYIELSKGCFQYGLKEVFTYTKKLGNVKVIIDKRINQPYIYYLFFNNIDPRTLNYEQINAVRPLVKNGYYATVPRYNNYYFENIPDKQLQKATKIYEVKDQKITWFDIYKDNENTFYARKNIFGSTPDPQCNS